MVIHMRDAKPCTKCGVTKSLESFYVCRRNSDGRRGDCKACFNARLKAKAQRESQEARWHWMNRYA